MALYRADLREDKMINPAPDFVQMFGPLGPTAGPGSPGKGPGSSGNQNLYFSLLIYLLSVK